MSFAPIEVIEIALNEDDGTYRLQQSRGSMMGRVLGRTVVADTIVEGLRDLADEIEQDALDEFTRRGLSEDALDEFMRRRPE